MIQKFDVIVPGVACIVTDKLTIYSCFFLTASMRSTYKVYVTYILTIMLMRLEKETNSYFNFI